MVSILRLCSRRGISLTIFSFITSARSTPIVPSHTGMPANITTGVQKQTLFRTSLRRPKAAPSCPFLNVGQPARLHSLVLGHQLDRPPHRTPTFCTVHSHLAYQALPSLSTRLGSGHYDSRQTLHRRAYNTNPLRLDKKFE